MSGYQLLSEQDVLDRMERFQAAVRQEQKLQQELMELSINGSRAQTSAAVTRHDELIAEVDRLRMTEMMPLLEELSAFVATCQELEEEEAG